MRERDERTRREIDELKKKRLEQRRVHVDAVDAIRAEADGKLRGAGPLNLLKSRAAPGGGSSSQTPSPGGSGDRIIHPAIIIRRFARASRRRSARTGWRRRRCTRASAPARTRRADPSTTRRPRDSRAADDGCGRGRGRQSRGEDSADRSRMEFARKIHAVEAASPNGARVLRRGVRGDRVPGGSEEDLPAQSQSAWKSLNSFLGDSSSPGANLRPRAPDASGGYDSSPDSLNVVATDHPAASASKDEAVTPNTKAALLAKAKNLLAEAKAPEQRKKMNEAVSVWTGSLARHAPRAQPAGFAAGDTQDPVERHRVPRPR